MNKKYFLGFVMCLAFVFVGCSTKKANNDDKSVLIYSSAEEYRNSFMQEDLNNHFPDYDITIEYMTSGGQAAKLKAEGTNTEADISYDLEYGYIDKLRDVLANLDEYDNSMYVTELLDSQNQAFPEYRNGGCIAINPEILAEKGLPEPTSYKDLLNPMYKGLISMPSPKSSGTGYMFLKSLVNEWGEDEAFEYFKELAPNVLQFTSSGSGPVNALIQGEAAIGLAMTAQAVTEINNGVNLEIKFFEEGSPASMYAMAIIKGKEDRQAVKDVFKYLNQTLSPKDKELFLPEKIYNDRDFVIENYPINVKYADMSNNTSEEKTRLLNKWEF
jgi:iron(III) transport system substrate-binding protein